MQIVRNLETRKWDVVDASGRVLFAYGRTKTAATYVMRELARLGLTESAALSTAYEGGTREFRASMLALKGVMVTGDVPKD